MSHEILTSDQFAHVISQAAAPAFLLGASASFLSVLFRQLTSLIDRLHAISSVSEENPASVTFKAARSVQGNLEHIVLQQFDKAIDVVGVPVSDRR